MVADCNQLASTLPLVEAQVYIYIYIPKANKKFEEAANMNKVYEYQVKSLKQTILHEKLEHSLQYVNLQHRQILMKLLFCVSNFRCKNLILHGNL